MNNSVEYFCESAPVLSDRQSLPLLQPPSTADDCSLGNGAFVFDQILITIG
ncbi:hypothetical protein [Nostoc sp. 'Peltigera membranacea cyanobiont' 213]|uniref:hypothetical protein n=1 Tax=Nostoc sp. 'Peltigera membranacea cyanobiont' 213 TaxID=2014530 RepID=UPI00167C58FB|nr:hypothetical protein [Nostoc sp. 'Peltigera membranacea cyanobiont' 213]